MMKPEIGSEFWTGCTPLNGSGVKQLLPAGMKTYYTLCGRTALELVLRDAMKDRQLRKAYLPSYCCHTMIEPFTVKDIQVQFYDVFFTDTGIGCDFAEDNDCDLVFLMDYFGFRDADTAPRAARQKAMGKCVVYDATHAMFCKNMDYSACDYVFGSFRKWFGVNAGFCAKRGDWEAFPVLTENPRYTTARHTAFDQKRRFMAGEPVNKDAFLQTFSQTEESLETDYMGYGPDAESLKILDTVNVDLIRRKRRENAACAMEKIGSSGIVSSPYQRVGSDDCPLFVPLKIDTEARTALRRTLIDNRIYLPIHWPLSDLHCTNAISEQIYKTELSFVCDQRYDPDDMDRAIQIIRSF